MSYLGIDVATRCGWALIAKPALGRAELAMSGVMSLKGDHGTVSGTVATFAKNAGWCIDVVGLEEPYLDKNPATLKVLARLVGRFEQAFEEVGCKVALVPAQTWQTAVLGPFGGRKREERKKACAIWAKAMFGREFDPDVADAAGLAYYLATRGRTR